jgi:hypothetical protein
VCLFGVLVNVEFSRLFANVGMLPVVWRVCQLYSGIYEHLSLLFVSGWRILLSGVYTDLSLFCARSSRVYNYAKHSKIIQIVERH